MKLLKKSENKKIKEAKTKLNESDICLLYKEGNRKLAGNYRPIALRHVILNVIDR